MTPAVAVIRDVDIDTGRMFGESDVEHDAPVAASELTSWTICCRASTRWKRNSGGYGCTALSGSEKEGLTLGKARIAIRKTNRAKYVQEPLPKK